MNDFIHTRAISAWLLLAFFSSFQLLPLLHALEDGEDDCAVTISQTSEKPQHHPHHVHCAICDRINSTQVTSIHTFSCDIISFVKEILRLDSSALPPLLDYTIEFGRAPPTIS